jgi:prolyl oligopeptidase
MRRESTMAIGLVAAMMGCSARNAAPPPPPLPPSARQTAPGPEAWAYPQTRNDAATRDSIFGVTVDDPFRWLENGTDDAVSRWAQEQDAFARRALDALTFRARYVSALKQAYDFDDPEPPIVRGERHFQRKRLRGAEKAIVYLRLNAGAPETALLDPNTWGSETEGPVSLDQFWPSPDGRRVAFSVTRNHSDAAELRIMDVDTGRVTAERIADVRYGEPSWNHTSDGFYYVWSPAQIAVAESERPGLAEVRFHRVGAPISTDARIRSSLGDPKSFQAIDASDDGRWLISTVHHGRFRDEVYVRRASEPSAPWRTIVNDPSRQAQYSATAHRDLLYVLTNDDADKFRVVVVDPAEPHRARWREIVPERKDATLSSFRIVDDALVLRWMRAGAAELEVRAIDGEARRTISAPAVGTLFDPVGKPGDKSAYVRYAGYADPPRILSVDVSTGALAPYPAGGAPPAGSAALDTEIVPFQSKDGTRSIIYVVRGRGRDAATAAPLILTGYGGFRQLMQPAYRPIARAWVESGGVYAEVVLRGGGEFGREWHESGTKTHKQNVFDDYVAAAEELVRRGVTTPSKLVVSGASNGGLLGRCRHAATRLVSRGDHSRPCAGHGALPAVWRGQALDLRVRIARNR